MARWLIILGIVLLVAALLWPWLSQLETSIYRIFGRG